MAPTGTFDRTSMAASQHSSLSRTIFNMSCFHFVHTSFINCMKAMLCETGTILPRRLSVCQSVSTCVSPSVCQSVSVSVCQSVCQSVSVSARQCVSLSISQSVRVSVCLSVHAKSVCLCINELLSETDASTCRSYSQPQKWLVLGDIFIVVVC